MSAVSVPPLSVDPAAATAVDTTIITEDIAINSNSNQTVAAEDIIEVNLKFRICKCATTKDITNECRRPSSGTTETPLNAADLNAICVLVHKNENNKIEIITKQSKASTDDDDVLVLRLSDVEHVSRKNGRKQRSQSFHSCGNKSKQIQRSATEPPPTPPPPPPPINNEIEIISNDCRNKSMPNKDRQQKWLQSKMAIDAHRSMDADDDDQPPQQSNKKVDTADLSKSIDNVSLTELADVGSVELIFISSEDIAAAVENSRNVIVLNELNQQRHRTNRKGSRKKQLVFVTDDFRRNSLKQNKAVVVDPSRRRRPLKQLKESAQQTSIDDVGNKITSHAFHSYDEEQEDLERKELHVVEHVREEIT